MPKKRLPETCIIKGAPSGPNLAVLFQRRAAPSRAYTLKLRSLSIIVPAFNEEQRLPETLQRISSFVGESAYASIEVIVVDDGSSDGTAAVVRAYAASDARFRLLQNPGNQGKGYAVRHGMLAATGEWRLMTDADLSTPIDEIQKLYANVSEHERIRGDWLSRARPDIDCAASIAVPGVRRTFFNLIMRGFTGLPFGIRNAVLSCTAPTRPTPSFRARF